VCGGEFSDEGVLKIAETYHRWRDKAPEATYEAVPGFCRSATLEEVKSHGYVLTPGRYEGAEAEEEDEEVFAVTFAELRARLDMYEECPFLSYRRTRNVWSKLLVNRLCCKTLVHKFKRNATS
jgi:hypothetical protein